MRLQPVGTALILGVAVAREQSSVFPISPQLELLGE
jgi:hypothetical protein